MCGILGAVTFEKSNPINENLMRSMRDTMVHRGPDAAGIWINEDKSVCLAHRRLSIIDLSEAANQPMSNDDETIWIVFNGEIYNHAEIRNELISLNNYKWKTDHSDTEVIIHAYEQWGINFISKLRGQYAISIWDARTNDLFLIRDRIGIKPLYYSFDGNKIVFASEIKAIIKDPDFKREVDEDALYDYFTFITVPAPKTLFKHIEKIPAGHYLHLNKNGQLDKVCYWDVLDHTTDLSALTEDELVAELRIKLRDAVKSHKVSDVPCGVFLSGGIDSGTNAVLFSEGEGAKINTFTIGFKGENKSYPNENEFAKLVSDKIGANYFEKLLEVNDLLSFLPEMIYLQDEPIADPVCVPVYYVSKLAKDNGITVCHVGEGSDELFYGYAMWKKFYKYEKLFNSLPAFIKRFGLFILDRTKYRELDRLEFVRRNLLGRPIVWGGAESNASPIRRMRIFSKRLKTKYKDRSSWEVIGPIYEKFKEKSKDLSILHWLSYVDLKIRLPELLLMRVDKMSMGVSIETRVPFLDHHLVEFAMSIPTEIKYKNEDPKYLLKKAVRGILPDEIIDRKKQGFGIPVEEWVYEKMENKIMADAEIFLNETDFFDKEVVINLLKAKDYKTWMIYNFIQWYNFYIRPGAKN